MFRACFVLTYASMIHALTSSTEEPLILRSRLDQGWSSHANQRDEVRNNLLSNMIQTVAKTPVGTQTNLKNVQSYQAPFNSAQAQRWYSGKGTVLPQIIQSKFYPQSANTASFLDSTRKDVVFSNLNPQRLPQPNKFSHVDETLTQNQSPLQESVWDSVKAVFDLRPTPSYQDQNEIDDDNLKNLLLPNNNPALAKSKQPSLTTWQDVQGRFTAGLALPSNPKLWKPPSYFQSLSELEDAMANIKMHFSIDENTPKNDPRYKYIAVVHVIEGLTREVSQNGWDAYNNNYDSLVLTLLDNINKHPEETMAEVNCVFEASVKKIQRIKKVMTNQWVDYLCKAQSCACDTLVYAIVKMSGDEELNQEAELLLLLGLAASDYLDIYSRVFAAISKQNVYVYLKSSKEALRPLIYKNTIARRHSSFSAKDQCYAQHSLREDFS